jgi:hypothetical protein
MNTEMKNKRTDHNFKVPRLKKGKRNIPKNKEGILHCKRI